MGTATRRFLSISSIVTVFIHHVNILTASIVVNTDSESDGDAQVLMGRMISTLQDLSSFVNRCYEVARNTMQQLSALHCGPK